MWIIAGAIAVVVELQGEMLGFVSRSSDFLRSNQRLAIIRGRIIIVAQHNKRMM